MPNARQRPMRQTAVDETKGYSDSHETSAKNKDAFLPNLKSTKITR